MRWVFPLHLIERLGFAESVERELRDWIDEGLVLLESWAYKAGEK